MTSWASLEYPLTVQECHQLAHVSETHAAKEIFEAHDCPIAHREACHLAFLSWLVYTKRLQVMGEPRQPFVSHDPRRSFS